MGFGKAIVCADSGQDLSHFLFGIEFTSVSNDRWPLLWICDPTNTKQAGYSRSSGLCPKKLAFIMRESLRSWHHRKVQLSVSSRCPAQYLTQYCGMSSQEGLSVVWRRRPALLWTCGWRSLKMYFSGPVSADAILSLFVRFTKMWWDSTTPNCYDHGFYDILCCFGSFAFMCSQLFT